MEHAQTLAPIGVIGLGKLGWEIAVRLLSAGYPVIGYRRSGASDLVAIGGQSAASPAEVAKHCRQIIVCLPSEAALHEVVNGQSGLTQQINGDSVVIEMSTFSEAAKQKECINIEKCGATMLDCTVSGKPAALRAGKAAIYVSGKNDVTQDAMPALLAISPNCVELGEFGAASRIKLVTNMLMTVNCLAAVEAMNLASALGFDPITFAKALEHSGAASAQLAIRAPIIANGADPNPAAIAGLKKDMALIERHITEQQLAAPLFREMRKTFTAEEAKNSPEGDVSLLFLSALKALQQG